ncbi:hypothetical protein CEXT_434601 [Caerostris extrusa]|uniref:Uncharacterized protein n=1 Tax=Caerostris extrusa TaxID=172846 RepID=A0AAV4R4K5_CAEEX|nr:hypothetical protein CEXT_434601 [Caerostris extrusa]
MIRPSALQYDTFGNIGRLVYSYTIIEGEREHFGFNCGWQGHLSSEFPRPSAMKNRALSKIFFSKPMTENVFAVALKGNLTRQPVPRVPKRRS